MKNLKFSQKLMLGIVGQIIFIALLVFYIFNLNSKLNKVSKNTIEKTVQLEEVKVLTALSKDFINDKVNFNELSTAFAAETKEIQAASVLEVTDTMWAKLKQINELKVKNSSIENQVMQHTDKSIQQSNAFVNAMSEKLAHRTKRKKVSIMERLVIGGANNNTNNNYTLKILFLKMKEDISVKKTLVAALDKMIQQATEDIEKLKNTAFAMLPVEALKANQQTLNITKDFITNVEKITILSDEISLLADASYQKLNLENIDSMDRGFMNIKSALRTIFYILIAISAAIVIINFLSSKIIQNVLKVINSDLNEMANGNLTTSASSKFIHRNDEFGDLSKSVNKLLESLKSIITYIRNGADNISTASQQLSSASQQISSGVNEQAAAAEEVSSSMEEMSANIQQNTENALKTRTTSLDSSNSVDEVAKASEESKLAVTNIFSKINVVAEIAEKTDLLAINAAVEAARAGDQGRGFAVVAAEVRKLAERSQLAAAEIVELAGRGMKKTEESTNMLKAIVPGIQNTSHLVDEIAEASKEQDAGAAQVNSAIQQLSLVTQQNAAASEEMAGSSKEMALQARELEEITRHFILENRHHEEPQQPTTPANNTNYSNEKKEEVKQEGNPNPVPINLYDFEKDLSDFEKM